MIASAATDASLAMSGAAILVTAAGVVVESFFRRQELGLLRRQLEGEAVARLAQGRGRLIAERSGAIHGSESGARFEFKVMNVGPAPVSDPTVSVRRGDAIFAGPQRIAEVILGEALVFTSLTVPRDEARAGGLELWGSWRDDVGTEEEKLLDLPRH